MPDRNAIDAFGKGLQFTEDSVHIMQIAGFRLAPETLFSGLRLVLKRSYPNSELWIRHKKAGTEAGFSFSEVVRRLALVKP